jgi:flagellar hook-length control protein FliK
MALNLLDSLNSTPPNHEKNSLSVKKRGGSNESAADFGQLLGGLMPPTPPKSLVLDGETSVVNSGEEIAMGQKVALEASDPTLAEEVSSVVTQPPSLTALVLSPNMTAITPSQPAPDAHSLVAFAKSQGLGEELASWLINAGKAANASGDANQTEAASEPAGPDAQSLAGAAWTLSLMTSPVTQTLGKPPSAGLSTEANATAIQLMPMTMPAAWLTPRGAAGAKTNSMTPSQPSNLSDKDTAHTSELDLSLIFGSAKATAKSPLSADAPFTPTAWAIAGLTGGRGESSTLLGNTSMARWLSSESSANDDSPLVEGLPTTNSTNPGKPNESAAASGMSKGSEPGMSVAERSEQHQAQAEKMGQAIGQRMISEMEKGHWHLKMMLRPANLGNIEVEMRLRNGELDANFTASQAVTRDLLQDGLPKLRDTLTQMGMDVASMHIGGGASQKNGGDPTPQQPRSGTSAAPSESQQEPSAAPGPRIASVDQDGLDVLV